jgi:hypothetical protein
MISWGWFISGILVGMVWGIVIGMDLTLRVFHDY